MGTRTTTKLVKGFYMTLDEAIYGKLREEAKRRGLSVQELIRFVVGEWLQGGK
jgi:Ribbon-helix-helix protein, copG family